jgi:hypothetical protein
MVELMEITGVRAADRGDMKRLFRYEDWLRAVYFALESRIQNPEGKCIVFLGEFFDRNFSASDTADELINAHYAGLPIFKSIHDPSATEFLASAGLAIDDHLSIAKYVKQNIPEPAINYMLCLALVRGMKRVAWMGEHIPLHLLPTCFHNCIKNGNGTSTANDFITASTLAQIVRIGINIPYSNFSNVLKKPARSSLRLLNPFWRTAEEFCQDELIRYMIRIASQRCLLDCSLSMGEWVDLHNCHPEAILFRVTRSHRTINHYYREAVDCDFELGYRSTENLKLLIAIENGYDPAHCEIHANSASEVDKADL